MKLRESGGTIDNRVIPPSNVPPMGDRIQTVVEYCVIRYSGCRSMVSCTEWLRSETFQVPNLLTFRSPGGGYSSELAVVEGLCYAYQMFDRSQVDHNIFATVERHVLLICGGSPHSMECHVCGRGDIVQHGILFGHANIYLSIISIENNELIKSIYQSTNIYEQNNNNNLNSEPLILLSLPICTFF